jgi:hypothetical protein
MTRMEITINVDEAEVLALRTGGQVPLSLRDKLGDAVHIREVGWYLVPTAHASSPRPRWWDGTRWLWGPDRNTSVDSSVVLDEIFTERLYLADER